MKTITLQGTKLALKTPYDEDEVAALKARETTENAHPSGKPPAKTANSEQTSNTKTYGKTTTQTTHASAGHTNTLDNKPQTQ